MNVDETTDAAIRDLARERGLSITDALRVLVAYGHVAYRSSKNGEDLLIRRNGELARVVLLS